MIEKVMNIVKNGQIVFPKILLLNYNKLNISDRELIILIYVLSEQSKVFNPKKISIDLGIALPEVMQLIDDLTKKSFLSLVMKKVNGLREEEVNVDGLYEKLSYLIINDEIEENVSTNIYDIFEKEFGRTLSPMEYEIIAGWLDMKFSEELIILALKEAIYNGVNNLRYIDKIIYEWNKKGYKNKEDVEKEKQLFQQKKVEKKELFDYDWLNDEE